MKLNKATLDKALTVTVAVASAVLPILVDQHVITALLAADIGSGLAVLTGGYHGGSAIAKANTEPSVTPLP